MENCSIVSQKVKYIPTMWSSHCTRRCLLQIKNHMSEDLDMNVHSICNNPKVETTQLSLSRWLAKPIVSHAHNGTPLSNEQGKATDTYNIWMNRKIIICCAEKARRNGTRCAEKARRNGTRCAEKARRNGTRCAEKARRNGTSFMISFR